MKRLKRFLSAILVYALLANAFFVATPNKSLASNIDVKQMTALFGEKVFICTPSGYKWVKWEDLQKPENKHSSKNADCKLCQAGYAVGDSNTSQFKLSSVLDYKKYKPENALKYVYITLEPYSLASPRSPPFSSNS